MQKFKFLVCSTILFLHDLSSNRFKPGWFLSFFIINILVRKDQVLNFYFIILNYIKNYRKTLTNLPAPFDFYLNLTK